MPSWKRVIVSGSSAHLNQITGSGGVKLPDGVRINFGDANDMKIYHSGAHSIIQDTGTGNLELKGSIIKLRGTSGGDNALIYTEDAGVELYYDNSKKLETVTGGVDITGAMNVSGPITGSHFSGSATSTGSFGRVENDSGRFYTSGSTLIFESPNLTDFKILQTGLGTNSAGPTITLGNAGQGNLNEGTIKFQIGRLVTNRGITADGQSVYATQFNTVNERGTADNAAFCATGNGGDGGGMYFGGGGAYDVRFSVTDEERLRLDTAGNGGGIQTSGSLSVGGLTAGAVAHVTATGNISGSSVSSSGDILADGDVIAYNSSDIRLKDNIEVIQGSLDKIGGIRGVEFDWNEKSPGWARERGHDVGVIAQEVQKVIPEIVVERKNGYLGVDYKRLVPLLIESVKELKQEVEILKKKVN